MNCKKCGITFKPKTKYALFCSGKCGGHNSQRRTKEYECKHCGVHYVPKHPQRVTYCSRECFFASCKKKKKEKESGRYPWRVERRCDVCESVYLPTYSHQRTCKTKCGWLLPTRNRTGFTRECKVCGVRFRLGANGSGNRLCSDGCKRIACVEVRREANRRRKARKKAAFAIRYRDVDIYIRDNWKCALCKRKVNRKALVPNPKAPTIDHILPIAHGGSDTPNNVQCAHFICNSLKSAKRGYQMRLFAMTGEGV